VSYTPMIKQYLEIKEQYPDAILFFRLGDFYEMFFSDAELASRELEITLTARDGGSERVPMCGVPFHAADGYVAKLVGKGYRVAICEQVEDPSKAKGIVQREVTRVVTPGTVIDGQLLEDKKNNYLCCIAPGTDGYGLAFSDISTGGFNISFFTGAKARTALLDELARLSPAEVIMPLTSVAYFFEDLKMLDIKMISGYREQAFTMVSAAQMLKDKLGEGFKRQFNTKPELTIPVAGALLNFLGDTQKRDLVHINRVQYLMHGNFMVLDAATRRNLELTKAISDGSRKNTLLSVLDRTVTAMGGRLIRNWIEQPLLDGNEIESRLDAVEELTEKTIFRQDIKEVLENIYDLERLAGKISFGSVNARDLIALKKSLSYLPGLKFLLCQAETRFILRIGNDIDTMEDITKLLDAAVNDDPPFSLRDGNIIKKGFNAEVDRLRAAGSEGKTRLAEMEERERARTGIKSLKVGFNKVFGYYIEVTKANLDLVPEDFQRRQTLANAERYITQELKEYEDMILGTEDRLVQLEYRLFNEIKEKINTEIPRIQTSATAVARADALWSLAAAAVENRYTRPELNCEGYLRIVEGRHPVLERVLETGQFVPNDTLLDSQENRMVLITGPNMAGKSTYMRQVALIVLMAQAGSFVPASKAVVPLVDRIFTRVGASDDLAGGQSTFMVEMNECRTIVTEATDKSLVIMDEVGRGTSTYDGISIARALAEYIHLRIKAKTLFSTHYHELTDLEQIPGIVNLNVAVEENGADIVFLRKVVSGKADRSYGIHVAKLAGLPGEVIERSAEILKSLEDIEESSRQFAAAEEVKKDIAKLEEHSVLRELRNINILETTPVDALNKLYTLKRKIEAIDN